jgi:TolB-like protein/Tfp pilus assembly protein PilF
VAVRPDGFFWNGLPGGDSVFLITPDDGRPTICDLPRRSFSQLCLTRLRQSYGAARRMRGCAMSEAGKAVFLSYASQDADAAKHICEALRSSGVEVWFDQEGGLEHGDEWDAKIRRQIKECVLFLPLISANTQAREEGYFRIEWDLAAERAQGIAAGVAFILPILVDDTQEPDALVPDRFRKVQWTRLPGGQVSPEVLARFLKLWSHRTGALRQSTAQADKNVAGRGFQTPPDSEMAGFGNPALQTENVNAQARKAVWPRFLLGGLAILVVGLVAYLALKPRRSPQEIAQLIAQAQGLAEAEVAKSTAAANVPLSEARQLAKRARVMQDGPVKTSEILAAAEELYRRALTLDPSDAEIWAGAARLDANVVYSHYDLTDERRQRAKQRAARAAALAPESPSARRAQACVYAFADGSPPMLAEAGKIYRELLPGSMDDKTLLDEYGLVLREEHKFTEAAAVFEQAGLIEEAGWNYSGAGQFADANRVADRLLASGNRMAGLQLKAIVEVFGFEDFAAASVAIAQFTPAELLSETPAVFATNAALWNREPDKAIAILKAYPQEFLFANGYGGPKRYLTGIAHERAGRSEAARTEWRVALQQVQERVKARPNDSEMLGMEALLLACLGEREEAGRVLELYRSLAGIDANSPPEDNETLTLLRLGRKEEILAKISAALRARNTGYETLHGSARFNPDYDPLRGDPRFEKLLRETLPKFAKPFADQISEDRGQKTAAVSSSPSLSPSLSPPSVPDSKSVAVLAFANLSDDKENEYFSDGISEELLTVLQKIPGLHVAARTSAFSFKGKNATAQEIGAKLGVAHLVEGSVQKSGTRVKVTAHLSRAATGEEMWTQSYTRELKDVFALQEELAIAIVGELRGQLAGGDNAAVVKAAVKGGTTNPEAYQQYLQGRHFSVQHSEKAVNQAQVFFRRAVDIDPSFALGWAGLARAHIWLAGFSSEIGRAVFETNLTSGREATARALALEPKLPEALLARAELQLNFDFDWNGAAENLRTALALAPANPDLLIVAGSLAGARGEIARSIELYQQAVALDPVSSAGRSYLAFQFALTGHLAEATKEYARVVELSPAAVWAHAGLGMAYLLDGRFEEAAVEAKSDSAEWAQLFIIAMARWGQKRIPAADAALARLTEEYADTAAYQIADVHAYRGDKDRAFEWLERARRQRDGGLADLKVDPFCSGLHGDPRWLPLLRTMGLTDEQLR